MNLQRTDDTRLADVAFYHGFGVVFLTGDLQWNVLIAATLAISAFVMVDSGSSDSDGGIPLMGVVMTLAEGMFAVHSCFE